MNRIIKSSAVLILLGIGVVAHAASFDCAKATSEAEKLICSDPKLSKLDGQLSRAYKRAMDKTTNKESVREWQRYWLYFTRESCYGAKCLYDVYTSQILELNEHAEVATNASGISGKYDRYYRGKLDGNRATINVLELKNNRVRLVGDASWIGNAEIGNINIGQIDGVSLVVENKVHYQDSDSDECSFVITFIEDGLRVADDNLRCGGLNVSFNGEYRKIESPQ